MTLVEMVPVLQVEWVDTPLSPLVEEVALSALLVATFVVGVRVAQWGRRRFGDPAQLQKVDIGIGVTLAGLGALVGVGLLSIWADTLARIEAFSNLPIANPTEVATRSLITVVLLSGAYVFTGALKDFVYEVTEDTTALTRHQSELLFRSTQVAIYVLVLLIVLGLWEVNLGGLLVGAGVLGIVIGLAAQQTLGSLLAGFVLMFARPFEIGDWVQIGDREGIVTEISIVNTRIQTFDGEYAMIPNDTVSSSEIVNRTRKGRLRIRVEVGVDYATDLDLAVETARDAMREVDDVLSVPQPQVVLKEFGNSAVVLGLRFWIDKPSSRRRWRAQTAVVREVKAAFDREGIKIPFPQRELMGRAEEGGFRLAGESPEADLGPPDTGVDDAAPDGGTSDGEQGEGGE